MNVFFWLLVLIAAFIVWVMLVALFRPIGKGIYKMYKEVADTVNYEEEKGEGNEDR